MIIPLNIATNTYKSYYNLEHIQLNKLQPYQLKGDE